MAKFLRDQYISNVTVSEELLQQIDDYLIEKQTTINTYHEKSNGSSDELILINYVIRFDNRGYKLTEFQDIKRIYSHAMKVERVIFTLESTFATQSNRQTGSWLELRFDANDQNSTYLQISSDESELVDSIFCGLIEIINKHKNLNGKIRNVFTELLIQLLGVGLGFVASLVLSLKIHPFVKIENSLIITFLFMFLVFSNTWGYINQQMLRFINILFPNIKFIRTGKSRWNWLWQALVGGLIVAFSLLVLNSILDWVITIMRNYVNWQA